MVGGGGPRALVAASNSAHRKIGGPWCERWPGVRLSSEEYTVTSRPAWRTAWAEEENRRASPRNAHTIAATSGPTPYSSWSGPCRRPGGGRTRRSGRAPAPVQPPGHPSAAGRPRPPARPPGTSRCLHRVPARHAPAGPRAARPGWARPDGTAWRGSAAPTRCVPRAGPGTAAAAPAARTPAPAGSTTPAPGPRPPASADGGHRPCRSSPASSGPADARSRPARPAAR